MPSPATVTSPARLAESGSVWAVPTLTPRNSRLHAANSPRAYSRLPTRRPWNRHSAAPEACRDLLDQRNITEIGGFRSSLELRRLLKANQGNYSGSPQLYL